MSESNKREKSYWDLESERQTAKTLRLLKKLEEQKKHKAEDNTMPMLSKPISQLKSTLYLSDSEDMAKYEREQREEDRRIEEEQVRTERMARFDIKATFIAFIIVVCLSIVGFVIAACISQNFEEFKSSLWLLVFIISTASIIIFYQEIKVYTVSKHIIDWKKSQEYINEDEAITESNKAKKSYIKNMVVLSILYYVMYILVTFTIGLVFLVLLAFGGLFRHIAIRWRP